MTFLTFKYFMTLNITEAQKIKRNSKMSSNSQYSNCPHYLKNELFNCLISFPESDLLITWCKCNVFLQSLNITVTFFINLFSESTLKLFYVFINLTCVYVWASHVFSVPMETRRGVTGTKARDGCEQLCGCKESKPNSQEEQRVLLTTKPSL